MRASYPQRHGSGRCPAHREVDCAVPLSGPPDNRNHAGGIQVISRAASLLRALDGHPQGLSLSQLSARISLPRSTVHRLVNALEREGFVAAASPNGRVRLGTELLRLAEGGRRDIQRELRPLMQQLFDDLNETVDLAVLDGDHLRFIDQIPAPHRLRAVSGVGATFPLHCTANGKAVLASLDDEVVKALVPARPSRYTPATIARRSELLEELAEVRRTGVALDREEHTEGISAGGFAVRDVSGTVAAISVPMPTQRFAGREGAIVAALAAARAEAVAVLGAA
jgi:IclR family transcriptional regulator, acetate operon repressor